MAVLLTLDIKSASLICRRRKTALSKLQKTKIPDITSGSLQIPAWKGAAIYSRPFARPSIASHKGGYPIWAAGAVAASWKNSFVLRANSPSRWHLTRCLLLCSGVTIHENPRNVNRQFQILSQDPAYPFPRGEGAPKGADEEFGQ